MALVVLLLVCAAVIQRHPSSSSIIHNTTTPKDMYVVRATVYQVGILTNKAQNTSSVDLGHQEAITFYRNNGSGIDMSAISHPLLTNVTAENVVGVAPITNNTKDVLSWRTLNELTSLPPQGPIQSESIKLIKREVMKTTGRIEKGAALIPAVTGVQSLALPPLLTLNNNMSKIPVPIPNVSVVSYAKLNTLVQKP